MPDTPQAIDMWARDLATEAKELAVRVSAMQEAHERACNERHADMRKWQEESIRTRHDLRTDMMGGFGELRTTIAAISVNVNANAHNAANRWIGAAAGVILILLGAAGYLIAHKGL